MAFDRLFCPIKNKSKKFSHNQTSRSSNENGINETNHLNGNSKNGVVSVNSQHATSIRYVTDVFVAQVEDELGVVPGDVVLYEFSDKDWSHVLCIRTNKRGFVPGHILSSEPGRVQRCRKKMPRSSVDPNDEHPLPPKTPHHSNYHRSNQNDLGAASSSNGEPYTNINLPIHQLHNTRSPSTNHNQQQRFARMSNSPKGSSGKESFQRYPTDFGHLSSPGYYNLRSSDKHYERYDMGCRPFHQENYGLFMVLNNFVAREENDLSVRPGDYVTVLNKDDEDWFWVRREYVLAEGFVPAKFICDYEQVKSILNKGNSTVTMKSSNQNDFHTYMNHGPDRGENLFIHSH